MEPKRGEELQSKNNAEYKNLASNTFYSFLLNYGAFFFTFIYSFLLARLITDETWDSLILATSYITIIVIITSFLPPGLNLALNYYLPRYIALNQTSKIKSLIKHSFMLKISVVIPVIIISLISFLILSDFFSISLGNNFMLLYILSPLILLDSLNFLLNAINRGFSKFNILFLLVLLKNLFRIGPLLIIFLFDFNISVGFIALIVVIAMSVQFVFNVTFMIFRVRKIQSIEGEEVTFKENIQKTFKYGKYLGFSDLIDRSWKEIQYQGVGIFESSGAVTGYNIAWNFRDLAKYSSVSFYYPLLTSFTSLNTTENYDQINKIYRIAYKINLLLTLIISGILFFSVDFMIDFVFLETRLVYSSFLRLMVIASVFKILDYFVQTLLNAQNKVKLSFLLRIVYMTYYIPLFFIGLIFFGVNEAIIFGLLIGNIISTIIQIYTTYRIGKIKLNVKKIAVQYATFFIPLTITWILQYLILSKISKNILLEAGLTLFKNFDFLSILVFLVIFVITNLGFKTVTSTDIDNFESLLDSNKRIDKIMKKGLNFIKKFTRK
ncbi:hypothetical protein LCGC14_0942670 [marine sediment metagenome]|uniref:Polysaccharide biosynthesis protein C-terminal domain-containing protein n=1 Tax=marine sediment metagenome TaxID=412755 RepID=A0A0F9R391_9ZZZZ